MVLLPDITLFEKFNNGLNDTIKRSITSLFYNTNNDVCLSVSLISLIEEALVDYSIIQALILELNDSGRLIIEKSTAENSFSDQLIEIYYNSEIIFLIPISLELKKCLSDLSDNLIVIKDINKINKHWVVLELLTKGTCIVSFNDFKEDNEIHDFFDIIFSIPKRVDEIIVFNRDQDESFLIPLKGKNITYYTLLKKFSQDILHHKANYQEMRTNLGNKFKLFFTTNPRIIHERKIILGNIFISSDNSFQNIRIDEPTWDITITYDKVKRITWTDKCSQFRELRN